MSRGLSIVSRCFSFSQMSADEGDDKDMEQVTEEVMVA